MKREDPIAPRAVVVNRTRAADPARLARIAAIIADIIDTANQLATPKTEER